MWFWARARLVCFIGQKLQLLPLVTIDVAIPVTSFLFGAVALTVLGRASRLRWLVLLPLTSSGKIFLCVIMASAGSGWAKLRTPFQDAIWVWTIGGRVGRIVDQSEQPGQDNGNSAVGTRLVRMAYFMSPYLEKKGLD